MKIGIIGGAGLLGSTTAFHLATLGVVNEIIITDLKENLLNAHVMDMEQAISEYNQTRIKAGEWKDLKECNIVLLSASAPETNVKSRVEYLESNMKIVRSVCPSIKEYCPNSIIINATNPVDVINMGIRKLTGIENSRIIGFSRNDTLRMRWAIAKVTGLNTPDISAICIGEHGENQVPLFSRVLVKDESYKLSKEQQNQAIHEISSWFTKYQSLNSGRTSGWTSALGLSKLIECIVTDSDEVIPCSVIPTGEYDLNDVSIGVPVRLGRKGVREIVEYPLTTQERDSLVGAAQKIKELYVKYVQ